MRSSFKSQLSSITRRDPVPRFGATLDVFAALDDNDVNAMLAYLAPDVVGSVRLPDAAVMTFGSRAEYEATFGTLMNALRASGVRCRTKIVNYDASTNATTVLASVDLDRVWDVDGARLRLCGHGTIVWARGDEGMKIVQWRVTWEKAREQSGDWSR